MQLENVNVNVNVARSGAVEAASDERIEALAYACADAALDRKGLDVVILDVRALVTYCDYFVLASGRSERQVQAIAEGVLAALVELGRRPLGQEGLAHGLWGILDYGDVVVHVFRRDEREKYGLEKLWGDAPKLPLEVPPELQSQSWGELDYEL